MKRKLSALFILGVVITAIASLIVGFNWSAIVDASGISNYTNRFQ